MKVFFLMLSYSDVKNTTNLYTDIVKEFVVNGHDVVVAAPTRDGRKTGLYCEGGVNVLRIKTMPLFGVNSILKGIANISLPYIFKRIIKKYIKQSFDLIIMPTPPITFCTLANTLKKEWKAKTYLILRDIFPQNAVDLGLLRNSLLISYFRKKEKYIYSISDQIGCMSQGNIDYVKTHNPEINVKKLHLLPNWMTYNEESIKVDDMNKEKYGFNGKFVAIFGGNIGLPQKLEFVIEVANKLRNNNDIVFLIVGYGSEKNRLFKMINDLKLSNVKLFDFLPKEEYNKLLAISNVGLITLHDKFTIPNIPSKTVTYMAMGKPILAAIDKATDYNQIIGNANCGLCSLMGDIDGFVENITKIKNNVKMLNEMGNAGKIYYQNYLRTSTAYQTIISKLDEAIS
ncbi:glycosyltransferase family 4 protein [uncultured Acetobacteroides sp.]|uniref:glycosyltransferase family 4 protein n=1 Tax=uncultured Acetobacteroides sp. TaxID=1760811 RepID=UPI0029F53892|nr:glycosyltransferase family 4 protein [uncultured Acetobacteroides sp.]